MKQLFLLNFVLALFIAPAQAMTVKATATNVLATYGSFSQTAGGTELDAPAGEVDPIITSDPATAIYGLGSTSYSAIDLGFGSNTVVTGQGADVVVFSLWNGYDYNVGLQAFATDDTLLSSYVYTVDGSTFFESSSTIATTAINLFDNSLNGGTSGVALGDDIELGYLRLFIGPDYNGVTGGLNAYSNTSLVGAFHTDVAFVPLPLPAVLFSSGLLLLGWIGRRKAA